MPEPNAPIDAPMSQALVLVETQEKRKLTAGERERIRERVRQWILTPEPYREPSTAEELANELGINRSTIYRIKQKIPKDEAEILAGARVYAVSRYPAIVKAMTDRAASGDRDSAKLVMQEVINKGRQDTGESKKPQIPVSIQNAMLILPTAQIRRERAQLASPNQAVNNETLRIENPKTIDAVTPSQTAAHDTTDK